MKRPIYLDNRERDLARRAFAILIAKFDEGLQRIIFNAREKMAFQWTRDELQALATKFEEPLSESADPPEKPDG